MNELMRMWMNERMTKDNNQTCMDGAAGAAVAQDVERVDW